MTQPVAIITGAVGGLGAEVASRLARDGYNLVLVNRSRARTEPLLRRLELESPQRSLDVIEADLADQDAIRHAAEVILGKYPRIEALFNVAGVLLGELSYSRHGNELHFQVNTLAPYMLMRLLRPALAAAGTATVLNVSSSAATMTGRLRVDKLRRPDRLRKLVGAYGQSKLALTTLTNALAKDFARNGIVLRSMDPGPNKTVMTAGDGMIPFVLWLRPLLFKSPDKGASDIIDAAFHPKYDRQTGLWIIGGRAKRAPRDADNKPVQDALLRLCSELTGV